MTDYYNPKALVDTQWVADHAKDPHVRVVEVSYSTPDYETGHIPHAVAGWVLTNVFRFNTPGKIQVEVLLSEASISNQNTIVLYGGLSNIPATVMFWLLKYYGHEDVRLLNGGRQKWLAENRPLTTKKPTLPLTRYIARKPNPDLRADKEFIMSVIEQTSHVLIDARSEEMYGRGHIPTAKNVPALHLVDTRGNFESWQPPTTNDDGTFMSAEALRSFFSEYGITPDQKIITYCVIGGLSSHMWFVLTQLLGYPNVQEYDLSWREWSNDKNAPVEQ